MDLSNKNVKAFFVFLGLTVSCPSLHAEVPLTANGYSVVIEAIVNGEVKTGSRVSVSAQDQVQLKAKVLQHGKEGNKEVSLQELRQKYDLSFTWYKIKPAANAFIDKRAIEQFSRESQLVYGYLTPMIPTSLKFKSEEFQSDSTDVIDADFTQPASKNYLEKHGVSVGSVRWKVQVHFEGKGSRGSFEISSPSESRLTSDFENLNYTRVKEVFLISRRGNTGYRGLDEALSYLGLPYIWWNGPAQATALGFTCSQLVSAAAFGKDYGTAALHKRPGIRVVGVEDGKLKGLVNGKTVFLQYGKHVQPGSIIVYIKGAENRHAAMIADDSGSVPGFLDTDDMMVHSTIGGVLGGNFMTNGIEYTSLSGYFDEDAVEFGMKIISGEPPPPPSVPVAPKPMSSILPQKP